MAWWHPLISATARLQVRHAAASCCCWWRSGRLTWLPCRCCCYSAYTPPLAHSQGHRAQGWMVDNFYLAAPARKHCFKVQFSFKWWPLSKLDPANVPPVNYYKRLATVSVIVSMDPYWQIQHFWAIVSMDRYCEPRCHLCIHIPHYPHPNPDPNPNPKSYPNLKLFNE